MKKLKILKGEVKEFIDTIKNIGYTEFMGECAEIRSLMGTEDIWDIIDFYSQPFKSKMITEYFEGWEVNKLDGFNYTNNIYHIACYEETPFVNYSIIVPQIESIEIPRAKTLSQFINNCVQVGIKLTWKVKK